MSRSLEKRLEKLEARNADPADDPLDAVTEEEWLGLAHLQHVLRANECGPSGAPVTDAEWAEVQQVLRSAPADDQVQVSNLQP